jgi:adenine-specific DNA-methyltransferase
VIKYLGSKRRLIPAILDAVGSVAPRGGTVLDLFSGTSRVGHALKAAGYRVLAGDHNAYAHTLSACYIQADAEDLLQPARRLIAELNDLAAAVPQPPADPPLDDEPPFVRHFARQARFFHPANARRIDALRRHIDRLAPDPELRAVLLVSLMEAADRVDSTTGVQMAYLKSWAPRALKPLALRTPALLPRAAAGKGLALCADAAAAARRFAEEFGPADVAYLDPPYNQHSYLGNYHIWETLVRWDDPAVYGTARKRTDVRQRRSDFNSRRLIAPAFERLLGAVRARALVVSFSDEGFLAREQLQAMLAAHGRVRTVEHDYPRYIGARIGIYNPRGEKVGRISHLRNTEYLFIVER